jgi:hypothetical protein
MIQIPNLGDTGRFTLLIPGSGQSRVSSLEFGNESGLLASPALLPALSHVSCAQTGLSKPKTRHRRRHDKQGMDEA